MTPDRERQEALAFAKGLLIGIGASALFWICVSLLIFLP